jgi:hypothetical protein
LDIPPFTISYAPVEAALVDTYAIAPRDLVAFRGRLAVLQKANLFGTDQRPGKGHKLVYTADHLHRLIFCCELYEFGIPPRAQLQLVADFWQSRIRRIFMDAETPLVGDRPPPRDQDIAMLLTGVSLMSGTWAGTSPGIAHFPLWKLDAKRMGLASRPRALLVNLTDRLRIFHDALAKHHHLHEEPKPTKPARKKR